MMFDFERWLLLLKTFSEDVFSEIDTDTHQ